MIARGEVALAVYATGQSMIYYENGVLAGIDPLVATIFLIVLSSIFCPVLLKLVFKNQISSNEGEAHRRPSERKLLKMREEYNKEPPERKIGFADGTYFYQILESC